jgi:hypothetical protein
MPHRCSVPQQFASQEELVNYVREYHFPQTQTYPNTV